MRLIYLVCLLPALLLFACQEKSAKNQEFKEIYDAELDVKKAIDTAVSQGDKRILLIFGANWCPWCQRLHHLMESNNEIKTLLATHYELILVDLGKRDRNMDIDAKYGRPNELGIPVLVLLDRDGTVMKTQETGVWEFDQNSKRKGHDPQKIIAFLKQWST
ncbi:thioredoxin fold domain-containing protein [candidate division KSB1 bacterium]|nr:thioredoxin fold domain-containing protein [candidate division KSB1 bacterium]